MNNVKKEWNQPALETLEVASTMEGKGTKIIDFVSVHDFDITS
ncbi:hypothetical protein PAECIP111893_03333 [Paenibacillus plantiphilus]|uniref:Paeninodin family lasso peptide n=1 Tax=Paenibacillus plantiphilus TaxID=2905650 RepID=A0ABN8GK89_9BACL|nr:paeninodin family lasso peptide [Paenibacillus plantiphilus]CAH1210940.1 hypothetical protein PAECIP111893_03333 [Paenibacillus plantiphilus]